MWWIKARRPKICHFSPYQQVVPNYEAGIGCNGVHATEGLSD